MMSPQRERYSTVRLDEDPSPAQDSVHPPSPPQPPPVDSTDYLPSDSDAYRAWLSTQPRHSALKRASLFLVVGLLVGLVAVSLTSIIDGLTIVKVKVVRAALNHKLVGVAWLFNALYSVTLVALSAELVLRFAPSAAGSGIPEVMAFLNGCKLPGVFTWRTAGVKLLSAALCVGSGLPVGPEGPVIFLGAALAGLVSQGTGFINRSGLARRLWPFGERFRNSKDKRDFMAAGAAAGVAAAFGAPIGGLLFVFEDVASFWTKDIGWSVFYTCAASVFATAIVDAVFAGDNLRSGILFEVTRPVRAHVLASALAAAIGLVAGVAAAAFTAVTLWWDRAIRSRLVGEHRRRRLLEPCVYALLFLTLAIVLPIAFPCRESGCVVNSTGGLTCRDGSAIARDLYGDTATGAGGLRERAVEESVEFYTCSQAAPAGPPTAIPDPGAAANATRAGITSAPESAPLLRKYNELATLMMVSGEDAIRHLFSRGTHLEFGFGALATFYLVYGTFAALTAGSSISSGLLIPWLLLGACLGRFCGLLSVNMATRLGYSVVDLLATDEWAWIDPGVFAVVGAAAFLGGGLRQALSVTVIVMEMTSEVHFLLPIMVATATAKLVSETLLPHGLYHSILRARRAPFLPSEPPAELASRLEVTSVRHIMSGPVVCVPEVGPLSQAIAALRRGSFHGFPVVSSAPSKALVGLISREHLRRVVARALETRPGMAMQPLTYPELEGRADRRGRRPAAWPPEPGDDGNGGGGGDDATPLIEVSPRPDVASACSEGLDSMTDSSVALDLRPYMNRSVVALPVECSVQRAYVSFRTLGLRHAPVVNQNNAVVGIVARAELLPERLSAIGGMELPGRN